MDKLNVVCATQLGAPFGMQLWGVGEDGLLYSTLQKTPSAPWGKWSACSGAPQQIIALTAAPARTGNPPSMSLWALTADHVLHCTWQIPGQTPGQLKWGPWVAPWLGAPKLTCMCAGLMGSPANGRYFSGWGEDGFLYTTFEKPGWYPWAKWTTGLPKGASQSNPITALTTAVAGNGCMQLWALTADGVLHSMSQTTPDSGWAPWVDGWWYSSATPALIGICASMQGGNLGRAIWGIGKDGHLYWTNETAQQGGGWTSEMNRSGLLTWPPFLRSAPGEPQGISSLCAARGNDGRVALWALSQDKLVHNTIRTTADGPWNNWDAGGTRFSPPSLLDEIVAVIERGDPRSKHRGVTYHATLGNTFTLLDTPQLWNEKPPVQQPIKACKTLLDKITVTISKAREILDITLMWETLGKKGGLPSGDFKAALIQGFASLAARAGASPLVRIMIGVPTSGAVSLAELQSWLNDVIGKNIVKFPIYITACKQTDRSWNHSKIVAADGVQAVVGGHNLWEDAYLGASPVNDVSGLFEGSVVAAAHKFCDQLWINPVSWYHVPGIWLLQNGKWTKILGAPAFSYKNPATPGKGTTRMLALGRLGAGIAKNFTVATNASVSARIIAMCRAKSRIRISQQSLYFKVGLDEAPLVTGFDFYTLWAIIKAVQAGVKVQIVISNQVPVSQGGYEGYMQTVLNSLGALQIADRLGLYRRFAVSPTREDIVAWAGVSLTTPQAKLPLRVKEVPTAVMSKDALDQLNSKLQVAPLYYAWGNNWDPDPKAPKLAANHAKVYIIDDTHFYVGSDNMYQSGSASGLQEYGYLVEGKGETNAFIQNYWNKLWQNSQPHCTKEVLFSDKMFARSRRQLRVGDIPADYPVFDLALASGDYAEPGTPWRYTT